MLWRVSGIEGWEISLGSDRVCKFLVFTSELPVCLNAKMLCNFPKPLRMSLRAHILVSTHPYIQVPTHQEHPPSRPFNPQLSY